MRFSEENEIGIPIPPNKKHLETLIGDSDLSGLLYIIFNPKWEVCIMALCYLDAMVVTTVAILGSIFPTLETFAISTIDVLYASDVCLTISYKFAISRKMIPPHRLQPRKWRWVIVDLITLFPYQKSCNIVGINSRCEKWQCVDVMRIYRLYLFYHQSRAAIFQSIIGLISQMCVHNTALFIFIMLSLNSIAMYPSLFGQESWRALYHQLYDEGTIKLDIESNWFILCVYKSMCILMINGYPLGSTWNSTENFFIAFAMMVSFVITYSFHFGHLCLAVLRRMQAYYIYFATVVKLRENLRASKVTKETSAKTLLFFEELWAKRRGGAQLNMYYSFIPQVMIRDIQFELFWNAFQHCEILRYLEVSVQRFLAMEMEQTYTLPGDMIILKGKLKKQFIYLQSGVIQVISNEDNTTPILSFSGGTVFGITTLHCSYPATRSIRCKTSCVVQILHRRRFSKLIRVFPKQYKEICTKIKERYRWAQSNEALIQNIDPYNIYHYPRSVMTLRWLKYTWKRLDANPRHILKIKPFEEEDWERMIFCAKYLNEYVMAEDVALLVDSVFVSSKCPCILKEKSPVMTSWLFFFYAILISVTVLVPYYMAFASQIPQWYQGYIFFVTTIWVIHIYLQMSTVIHVGEESIVDFGAISFFRMGEPQFWIDIMAALPIEFCSFLLYESIEDLYFRALQTNRLLKIIWFRNLFNMIENSMKLRVMYCRAIQCMTYIAIMTYFMAAGFKIINCLNVECSDFIAWGESLEQETHILINFLYSATDIMTGASSRSYQIWSQEELIYMMVLMFFGNLYGLYVLATISSSFVLDNFTWVDYIETLGDLHTCIEAYKFPSTLRTRIWRYFYSQYEINKGSRLDDVSDMCPTKVMGKIRQESFYPLIDRLPIFKGAPDNLIRHVCEKCVRTMIPRNEIVTYRGSKASNLYVIFAGHCTMISSSPEQKNRLLSRGDSFSVVEAFIDIPCVHTIVALTTCVLVELSHELIFTVLSQFPDQLLFFKNAILEMKDSREYELRSSLAYEWPPDIITSYVIFDFDPGSDEYTEFNRVYEASVVAMTLRIFLNRRTYLPAGAWLIRWEFLRCTFAFASIIVFSNPFIVLHRDWGLKFWLMLFLDCTAYADLFIQLHVCYYNKEGLLISHPLRTAEHYLSNRFIVDLFCCFPFDQIWGGKTIESQFTTMMSHLNRLFQIYRVRGLTEFYKEKLFHQSTLVRMLMYSLLLISIINLLSTVNMMYFCVFDESLPATDLFGEGVHCDENSWLAHSEFPKPMNVTKVYLYAQYYIVTMVTASGMRGYQPASDFDASFGIFVTFIGFFLFAINAAVIISCVTSSDKKPREFKSKMQNLDKFMRQSKLQTQTRQSILSYYQTFWIHQRCINPCLLYKKLPDMLRQDALLASFGNVLKTSTIFKSAPEEFLRKVLIKCSSQFYKDEGIVIQLNDVVGKLCIVGAGTVDVYGPAGAFFGSLKYGSIFGTLDDTTGTRQPITVKAKGHCIILKINATEFHKELILYPDFQNIYYQITRLHFDFVPNLEEQISQKLPPKISDKKRFIFTPNSIGMLVWKAFFLLIVCFFSYCYELFHISTCNLTFRALIVTYILDALFLLNILVQARTGYKNEFGVMTYTKTWRHYRKSLAFKFDFIIAIPFEIYAFAFNWESFIWCRINKLFRLSYPVIWCSHLSDNLTDNVHVYYLVFVTWFSIMVFHGFASFIMGLVCYGDHVLHMTPEMEDPTNLQYYMYHIQVLVALFYSGNIDHDYYPLADQMIILICIIILIFRISLAVYIAEISVGVEVSYTLKNLYQRNVIGIQHFLYLSQVSQGLVDRVMRYLKTFWAIHRHTHYPTFLEESPYSCREQVLNDMFAAYFVKHEVFRESHPDLLRQIVSKLKVETFYPMDTIIAEGDFDDCMFCIHTGMVESLDQGKRVVFGAGMLFCIEQGLKDVASYPITYRAVATSTIILLHFKDWKYFLDYFPASWVAIDNYKNKIR